MKKAVFLIMMCLMTLTMHAQSKSQFVDLGLPSGTLWKQTNETIEYSFADAIRYFDGFLPTSGQFKELIDNCQWKWTGHGYKVIGVNGKSIYLSAEFKRGNNNLGAFWSTTKDGHEYCYGLLCYPSRVKIDRSSIEGYSRNVILCK